MINMWAVTYFYLSRTCYLHSILNRSDDGCKYYPDVDTEIDELNEDRYTISGDDPTSSEAFCSRSCKITYKVLYKDFIAEKANALINCRLDQTPQ